MLVLSRKKNESVVVNENVVITVVALDGNRVRLGFNAAADVPINRLEVHQQIIAERAAAKPPEEGAA